MAIADGDQIRRWLALRDEAGKYVLREIAPVTVPGARALAITVDGWLYATDAAGEAHGVPLDVARPGL